jgi:serine protein kinase
MHTNEIRDNMAKINIFEEFRKDFDKTHNHQELTIQEYLDLCAQDKMAFASPAERMLAAIGEPVSIDTKSDPRLAKIFSNKIIRVYPAFKDFYGLEDTIEQIVSFFRHAAQGLEESKQILYLLGPVGGGKSTIAEKLKELMEHVPVYVLKDSPVFESPLGLFNPKEKYAELLQKNYDIPHTAIRTIMSPWAVEKLNEYGGDISQFKVVKIYPSRIRQVCITRVEPGDKTIKIFQP